MELKTYQAYSMSDALAEIRKDLGENAVILHTRTFRRGGFLGFGGKNVVEVTASGSAQVSRQPRTPRQAPAKSTAQSPTKAKPAAAPVAKKAPVLKAKPQETPVIARRNTLKPQRPARAAGHIEIKSAGKPAKTNGTSGPAVPLNQTPASTKPIHDNGPIPFVSKPVTPAAHDAAPDAATNGTKAKANEPHSTARRFVIDVESGCVRRVDNDSNAEAQTPPPTEKAKASAAPSAQMKAQPSKPIASKVKKAAAARTIRATPPASPTASTKVVAAPVAPTAPAPSPSPAPPSNDEHQMKRELAALRQMVGQVLQKQAGSMQPQMPEALLKQYLALVENEVERDLADEICGLVRDELTPTELADAEMVHKAICRHLCKHIPVADDSTKVTHTPDGRPLTIALVGPTGVGKTTTVAKLAAAIKLREGRRVGLITTDTYRIAAVDQLRTYANIIGVPLKVALTPTEIASACHALRECDVILIDTAGRSPNDDARIDEIRQFIEAANPHEVHLVLSSTSSESVLLRTIEQFSAVNTDRVILTKLDEAVGFGVIVNVMRKVGKTLSFVTMGQEVPDHIEAGRPDRIARLILGEKVHE